MQMPLAPVGELRNDPKAAIYGVPFAVGTPDQVVEQTRVRRGASIVVAKNSTIANDNTLDVTAEVLTALNAALPSVSVTPLPQQQQTTPQGR